MNTSSIPDDIRRFVIQCVPSVPYLEAVLLMRENRRAAWPAELLARRLYLNGDETQWLLNRLVADGVVELLPGATADYRYAPASGGLEDLWDRLATVYMQHLIEISTLIHAKPAGKAQMLADAFVWRKEK